MPTAGRARRIELFGERLEREILDLNIKVSDLEKTVYYLPDDSDSSQYEMSDVSDADTDAGTDMESEEEPVRRRQKKSTNKKTDGAKRVEGRPLDEMKGNCYLDAKLFVPIGKRTDCQAYEALYGIWPNEVHRISRWTPYPLPNPWACYFLQ